MKKFLAAVLAVAMVASMAAVSFAADKTAFTVDDTKYTTDTEVAAAKPVVTYGKTVYYAIDPAKHTDATKNVDAYLTSGVKIKAKWEMGGDLVESVKIVKDQVAGGAYQYFLAVKVADKASTSDADIVGTLTLNKSYKEINKSADKFGMKDMEVNVEFAVQQAKAGTDGASGAYMLKDVNSDVQLADSDERYYVTYDYDSEIAFSFGKEPNEGEFTVDVSGQNKMIMGYNTKVDAKVLAANPAAIIAFHNFGGAAFNRSGEMLFESETAKYVYEVKADGAVKLVTEFVDEEATFKTRVLGNYAISDVELVSAPAVVETPVTDVNPDTGVNA